MVTTIASPQLEAAVGRTGALADQVSALVLVHLTDRDNDSAEVVGRSVEMLALIAGHRVSIRSVNLDKSPPVAEVRIFKNVRDELAYCAELQAVLGPAVRFTPYIGPLAHTRGGRDC